MKIDPLIAEEYAAVLLPEYVSALNEESTDMLSVCSFIRLAKDDLTPKIFEISSLSDYFIEYLHRTYLLNIKDIQISAYRVIKNYALLIAG